MFMERELWNSLYGTARLLDKPWGCWEYSSSDILAVYFWSVVHDRPMVWAVTPENWPEDLRPQGLPCQSTMSRRMRKSDVQQLMTEVETTWLGMAGIGLWWMRVIDAKGLTVNVVSKDADVGYGPCAGKMAKGYKFFAVWGGGPLPSAWALGPMNKDERNMARALIPGLPGSGYLLGDGVYDANDLYDLAHENGYRLLAPKKKRRSATGSGIGHRPQSPERLRSIELLKKRFGKYVFRFRRQIERDFAGLTNFAAGLSPLPAWVRRFPRVRNWVHAKLLINAARWLHLHLPEALALA
jgi:hypothetical protein